MKKRESGWRRKKGILLMDSDDQIGCDLDLTKTQQITSFLGPFEEKIGLDIGCGLGLDVRDVSRLGGICIGCDLDSETLRVANAENERKLIFVCASADSLPFRDLSFDYILAFDILEHVKRDQLLLSEVSRVSKPSGLFVLNVPNGAGPWELYRRLAYFAIVIIRNISGSEMKFWPNHQSHIHFYSLFELQIMLKRSYLKIQNVFPVNLFLTMILFAPIWYLQIAVHKSNDEGRLRLWENMQQTKPFYLMSKLDRLLFNRMFFLFNTSFMFLCRKS